MDENAHFSMADVAQLVRALDCGSGGRGFETRRSPSFSSGIFPHFPVLCRVFQPLAKSTNEKEESSPSKRKKAPVAHF